MKIKVDISYSKDDLDSWQEGRKTYFIIETPTPISDSGVAKLASAYLDALGVNYREFIWRSDFCYN